MISVGDVMKQFWKNFSYTFMGNFVTFLVNVGITFIVPRFIGVNEYSYYQLFAFYISYVGYLQFGWADGIYLRLGGKYYNELDKRRLKKEMVLYAMFTIIVAVLIILFSQFVIDVKEKQYVVFWVGISVINILPITLIQYILQATNRIKEYATVTLLRSVLFAVVIGVVLLMKINTYKVFCVGYVFAQFISLCYAIYTCRDIIFNKCRIDINVWEDIKDDISRGIKLTIAMISSVLIIGVVRFSIERQWDVETFGKISLTISISNFLMLFVRAVSLIMFPKLRRTNQEKLGELYITLRTALIVPLMGMVVLYYPLKEMLSFWLPQYADSLKYMVILFPLCIYESKMSMLIESYLKTLHKEKWLLWVNVLSVLLSIVCSWVTVFCMKNLDVAVFSILILIMFRCICAELLLDTILNLKIKKDIILEVLLTILFIVVNLLWGILGIAIYIAVYILYLYIKKNDVEKVVKMLKQTLKKEEL